MKTNGLKAWVLAARPKTLTGAVAPVLVGGMLAYTDSIQLTSYAWWSGMLCLLFAVVMQIDANFVNDYYDFKKGTDREDRLGPERACAQGWITPKAMQCGIGICTIFACLVGLVILFVSQRWELLIVGIACVLGCFLYTIKFSYLGLGDILVLLFFGIVPVGFTYYVMTGGWTLPLSLASIGMGLATDNLLIVNNYRDRHQDAISGKKTIIVRMGGTFGLRAYLWCGIIATILGMTALYMMDKPYWFMLGYLLLNIMTWYKMCHLDGKALNGVLGQTARNIILYGLLLAGAMVAA
ncbi:MAG: 1,4-dihydroxy-2-naphthoate octaprenyltransferase [Bacteroidaceae bacterium]|nr:1,4-dihydroxy-2-naphthoate octaprenyltransferase [Bacteroidaceae bacterium]